MECSLLLMRSVSTRMWVGMTLNYYHTKGQHAGLVVSPVASQKEVPGFNPRFQPGLFLC